jgi:hypothetical protein
MTTTMFHVHFLISKNFMKFKISLNRSQISKIQKNISFYIFVTIKFYEQKVSHTLCITKLSHWDLLDQAYFQFHGNFTKKTKKIFQWTLRINMNGIVKWCSFKISQFCEINKIFHSQYFLWNSDFAWNQDRNKGYNSKKNLIKKQF